MRITVRGWGRNEGKKEIMDTGLSDAETGPVESYSRDKVYLAIENPENRSRTSVRVSTHAELRLGGNYLLQVVLSRKEIAQLFFATHSGAMTRMIQSFIQEEEREDRARLLEQMAQLGERRRQRLATEEEPVETSAPLD
jgi:hypothetical protein